MNDSDISNWNPMRLLNSSKGIYIIRSETEVDCCHFCFPSIEFEHGQYKMWVYIPLDVALDNFTALIHHLEWGE